MKTIVALSSLVFLFVLTVDCEISSSSSSLELDRMPEKQWAEFKLQHNKNYEDEEDKVRFEIFKKALITIQEHNEKYERGETTFKMGLNHMTDWKDEERKGMMGLRTPENK